MKERESRQSVAIWKDQKDSSRMALVGLWDRSPVHTKTTKPIGHLESGTAVETLHSIERQ